MCAPSLIGLYHADQCVCVCMYMHVDGVCMYVCVCVCVCVWCLYVPLTSKMCVILQYIFQGFSLSIVYL